MQAGNPFPTVYAILQVSCQQQTVLQRANNPLCYTEVRYEDDDDVDDGEEEVDKPQAIAELRTRKDVLRFPSRIPKPVGKSLVGRWYICM